MPQPLRLAKPPPLYPHLPVAAAKAALAVAFPIRWFNVLPSFQFCRHPGESLRHSGASRNLHAATDSGFRRRDRPTPKPPERNHCPPSRYCQNRRVPDLRPRMPATFLFRWFRCGSVIPAQASVHPGKSLRHSGASRNLHAAIDSGFRRSHGSTPKPPDKETPPPSRYCQKQARIAFPPPNAGSVSFLGGLGVDPSSRQKPPSFRRKPESTRCDGLRFSPARPAHI